MSTGADIIGHRDERLHVVARWSLHQCCPSDERDDSPVRPVAVQDKADIQNVRPNGHHRNRF